jgi:methionyl-tRNA formyltransferase
MISEVKIIFMGTPEFGAIILEGLIKARYKPILVATAPDKPVGRKQILTPPPVKVIAQKYGIAVFQPEKILRLKSKILNLKPDLIIAVAYGKILPKEILEIPKYGCLAVHPSLLPKYRGPSPIQTAILNGDRKIGVTIFLMDEKMDHGPILARRELELSIFNSQLSNRSQIPNSKITYTELSKKLAKLGAKLLIETIPKWIKGEIKPVPQEESKATYTKILKKEDGKINWRKTAEELERQIRAFDPWPGSFTFWYKNKEKIRLKFLRARVLKISDTKTYLIGKTLVAPQNELCVQTGQGFLIIEKLQPEGKKEMFSEDFLRGHPDFIGTILK